MFARSVLTKCPNCHSDRVRRSHRRPDDSPWRSLLGTAYRCRQCGTRTYYRASWLLPGLAFASLVLLTFVLGFALGALLGPAMLDANVTVDREPALDGNASEVQSVGAVRPVDPALAVAVAAAESGDAKAQLQLGKVYMKGTGVERNPVKALKWIEKSAEQGYAEAQHALGSFHQSGLGAPQNFTLASKWFEQAAEQNHAEAQYSLGTMYRNGHGVAIDKAKAYIWFNLAAAQGHERAGLARDNLLPALTSEQLVAAQRATQQWQPAQANK